MAGGFIPTANIEKMGHLKRFEIEQRFIRACAMYLKEN